jgi:hypothetical protein
MKAVNSHHFRQSLPIFSAWRTIRAFSRPRSFYALSN